MLIPKKEAILFNCLREDSRKKLRDISRHTNIPISTAYDILNKMRIQSIDKFTILPRYNVLGYKTHAIMIIRPSPDARDSLSRFLNSSRMINSFFVIDGTDFLIDMFFKDNSELNRFCKSIEGNYKTFNYEVHLVLDEIKKEGFLLEAG